MKEKFNSRYAKLGLTIFVAGAALILLFEAVINIGILSESFSRLMSIISPFIQSVAWKISGKRPNDSFLSRLKEYPFLYILLWQNHILKRTYILVLD